ncbi:GroES-like protein [Trametes meyenii]|nr:GroES-like protein [Trametes meyenii]
MLDGDRPGVRRDDLGTASIKRTSRTVTSPRPPRNPLHLYLALLQHACPDYSEGPLVLPAKKGEWIVNNDFPVPTPGPKDVLVKIVATALNPVDRKIPKYGMIIENFPYVGGTYAAGTVEEVGAEVTNFARGDKIFYQGWFDNPRATFQQYGIVPAEVVAKILDNITFEQAASVPLSLSTVATGLYNHDPKARSVGFTAPWEEAGSTSFSGKPAFIIGGSSSVGQYAIQFAKLSGFSPIIATASLHNEALLKSLGATHVIDRKLSHDEIVREVSKIVAGKPVEYAYDAISLADTEPIAYDVLAPGGSPLLVLPDVIPAEKKKEDDNKKIVVVFGNVQTPENRQLGVDLYRHLTEYLEKGLIVPNRIEVLPNGLAGIPEGLERLKADKVSAAKLVGRPHWETP